LPAWSAGIVQVPTAIALTTLPETVQTLSVWLVKVTGNPEPAVVDGSCVALNYGYEFQRYHAPPPGSTRRVGLTFERGESWKPGTVPRAGAVVPEPDDKGMSPTVFGGRGKVHRWSPWERVRRARPHSCGSPYQLTRWSKTSQAGVLRPHPGRSPPRKCDPRAGATSGIGDRVGRPKAVGRDRRLRVVKRRSRDGRRVGQARDAEGRAPDRFAISSLKGCLRLAAVQ